MKEINLEEILIKNYGCKDIEDLQVYLSSDVSIEMIKEAMKEACGQAIELCAENARIMKIGNSGSYYDAGVNPKSILNTINQIV